MRFEINLASQPYLDVQRFLARWGLALIAVALLTAGLVSWSVTALLSWRVTEREIRERRNQIAKLDQQKSEVQAFLNRPENRETRDRSEFLNSLFARKAFSWTEVFTDLEKLVPPRLHVAAVHPVINESEELELHLLVAGTSRDAAIELQRRLEQSPHFTHAAIVSETAHEPGQGAAAGGDTVQFELRAIYLPSFMRGQKQRQQQQSSNPAPTEAANAGR